MMNCIYPLILQMILRIMYRVLPLMDWYQPMEGKKCLKIFLT